MRKRCGDCGDLFEAPRSARFCSDACRMRAHRKAGKAARNSAQGESAGPGPVESRVRADIEALMTAHPMGEALTEMSVALARAIDQGTSLMGIAAVNRELRENLAELSKQAVDDGDEFSDELSAPVRYSPES